MNKPTIKEKYSALTIEVRASLWYTVGNVINKGIALFATPIFTRIMTEEQYGTFTIFQSWFSILIIFTSLNLFLGGYQKGLILYKDDINRFSSSQLGLTTTITVFAFCLYILDIPFWTKIFDLAPTLMFAMFIELLLMPAIELWGAQQRFDYKFKSFVSLSLAMSILSILVAVVAVLTSSYKIEARVFSDVAIKAIFSGALFVLIFVTGKCFYKKDYWKYSIVFNLPLIPHYISHYILNQSDRIMIGRMVGNTQAAYYSVAYTISTVIFLIINAINNSLTPYIYKTIASGDGEKIKNNTQPLIILVAVLCTMTMIFAPEVIWMFAGNNYLDAIYVIPPIAASIFFIFLYSLFSIIEYYYQKTALIALATSVSALLNLLLNYFCINIYGYYAAGYTTLISYMVMAFFHYVFYKRIIKNIWYNEDLYNVKLIISSSATVISLMIIISLTYQIIWLRYVFLIVMIILSIIFKKNILKAFCMLRK